MIKEKIYLNAFNLITGIGWSNLKKIKDYFGSFENAWLNFYKVNCSKIGLSGKMVEKIISSIKKINPEKEFEKLNGENISFILKDSEEYPSLLKEIYDPPFGLYVKGNFSLNSKTIAVVGTRRSTSYGNEIAKDLVADLAKTNLIIISGLARGIDTIAHQTAIQNTAKTIAVLGSGVDTKSIYPSSNRRLAAEIINSGGAIVSEFPLGTAPLQQNFPLRNRIISGLSKAVVVVEAPEKSGALITAMSAIDQGRDVFAVPGSIFSKNSSGCHKLIKLGAKLVESANDIFEELGIISELDTIKIDFESKEEELIFNFLEKEPAHIDKMIEEFNLAISDLSMILANMELKGFIKNIGNNFYTVNKLKN